MSKIYLPEKIGGGYGEFWKYKGRYRVLKGGRGSKKSCTMALWLIYNIMKYPLANAVGGSPSTYYGDYYYQFTGQRIARLGGGLVLRGGCGLVLLVLGRLVVVRGRVFRRAAY